MQPTIKSQIISYDEYLILKNYSSATRKMYLRTLISFLRFASRKHPHLELSQELARQYIISRHKEGKSWSTINVIILPLENTLGKYFAASGRSEKCQGQERKEVCHASYLCKMSLN